MNRYYVTVAARAIYRCEYCRAPEEATNFVFEVEHIIPLAHGGANESENLALSCRACNIFKADFLHGADVNGAQTERLFNPRFDNWQQHFRVNLDSFEIEGLTEIGRGTINRLRMNSERQLRGRRQWARFGLFP